MLRACLHLRKSTDEHQAESIETQEKGARAWCEARGMTVVRVIAASGVSRAEIVKRDDLHEALELAKAGAYDVLVTRDISRLVGDVFRGGSWIESLLETGARLFYYYANREIRIDDPTWKMMTAFESASSESERKQLAGRTREALERKAAAGLVAGGRCYGYRNVHVFSGPGNSGKKLRTEYAIDDAQAAVVRRVYELFASGEGYRGIARILNAEGVPSSRGGSWDMSSIGVILANARYFGRLEWGRIGSAYKGGTHIAVRKAETDVVAVDAPHLRIVPIELELKVSELRKHNARLYSGRTALGAREPKYMLVGLAKCACCGGPICPRQTKRGAETIKVYGCRRYFASGRSVCRVNALRPMSSVDRAVLDWFAGNVLTERFVRRVYAIARERLRCELAAAPARLDDGAGAITKLRAELGRLARSIASGDAPETIVKLIGQKERELKTLEQRRALVAAPTGSLVASLDRAEALARQKVAALRELLSEPQSGRKALASLLDGPLVFRAVETAEGRRFELSGRYTLGPMLASEGVAFPTAGDPNGFHAVGMHEIAGDFRVLEAA